MTTTKHLLDQAIRDHIAEHTEIYTDAGTTVIAVLDLHAPDPFSVDWNNGTTTGYNCSTCFNAVEEQQPYPCPTVQRIAEQLLDPMAILIARGFVEVVDQEPPAGES